MIIIRFFPLFFLFVIAATVNMANADYRLAPGDEVRLGFIGVPDGTRVSVIDDAGIARFPLVGPISAEGLTLDEFESAVQEAARERIVAYSDPGGNLFNLDLGQYELFAEMSEYRPAYVLGAVPNPGRIPYRPGMTVQAAIASTGGSVADGFSPLEGNANIIANTTRQRVVTLDLVAKSLRLWHLQNILSPESDMEKPKFSALPVRDATIQELAMIEDARAATTVAQRQLQQQALENEIRSSKESLDLIERQLSVTQGIVDSAQASLTRLEELGQRGLTVTTTVELAQQRYAQSGTQLIEILRLKQDLESRLREKNAEFRQVTVENQARDLTEKAALTRDVANARQELEGLRALAGAQSMTLAMAGSEDNATLKVSIARGDEVIDDPSPFDSIQPGDVVSVRLASTTE